MCGKAQRIARPVLVNSQFNNFGDDKAHLCTVVPVFGESRRTHIHSSCWHCETHWKIAMPIGALTAVMIRLHLI